MELQKKNEIAAANIESTEPSSLTEELEFINKTPSKFLNK